MTDTLASSSPMFQPPTVNGASVASASGWARRPARPISLRCTTGAGVDVLVGGSAVAGGTSVAVAAGGIVGIGVSVAVGAGLGVYVTVAVGCGVHVGSRPTLSPALWRAAKSRSAAYSRRRSRRWAGSAGRGSLYVLAEEGDGAAFGVLGVRLAEGMRLSGLVSFHPMKSVAQYAPHRYSSEGAYTVPYSLALTSIPTTSVPVGTSNKYWQRTVSPGLTLSQASTYP